MGVGALGAVQQLPAETSQRRKKTQTEMKFFAQGQQIHYPFSPLLPATGDKTRRWYGREVTPSNSGVAEIWVRILAVTIKSCTTGHR